MGWKSGFSLEEGALGMRNHMHARLEKIQDEFLRYCGQVHT